MAHGIDPRARAARQLADRESFALLKAIPCPFRLYASFVDVIDYRERFIQRAWRDQMTGWRVILGFVIGAVIASLITAGVFLYAGTKVLQANTARDLLAEVVAIEFVTGGLAASGRR